MTEETGKKIQSLIDKGDIPGATNLLSLHLGKTLTGFLPHSEATPIAKTILGKLGHIKL